MEGSDTYFYFDGTNVVGPHAGGEISEMFHKGILNGDTQVCTSNDVISFPFWTPLGVFLGNEDAGFPWEHSFFSMTKT